MWRTTENVVVNLVCCRDIRVDVNFRCSIYDIGLALDNVDEPGLVQRIHLTAANIGLGGAGLVRILEIEKDAL